MIKIRIKNADHEIDVRFPISENELYAKLAEIHAIEEKDAPQSAFVTEVYWPEEFSMLKDRFANLDELNYLAKRMESFDYHEYDQFLIGITKLQNPTEKDLINLTFNLDHFTLCKDVSSYGKIGREYVMNTQGAVPANDEDDPKYAAIGKELIDKGLAQITGKGLLIYNPFDELTEVYDGQTFPEYYYENIRTAQPSQAEPSIEQRRLDNEIARTLEGYDFDKDALREKLYQRASLGYLQIGDEAYVEHKLKNTLEQHDTLDSFDSELTNKTVKLIKLAENGSVSIILINDQEIRKEQTDHANSNPSDAT